MGGSKQLKNKQNTIEMESNLSITENYKMLKNNIQYMHTNPDVKSILVTSTKEGEGKTTTAANLAMTMAKSGKKTLLIDFDFNHSSIHKLFNVSNNTGVITVLKKNTYSHPKIIKSDIENLYILPSGVNGCHSTEVFLSERIEALLINVKKDYDFIIIDGSAIMDISDVQIISRYVDGCLLVVKEGSVEIEELKKAKDALEKVNAKILGAVFHKVDMRAQRVSTICATENKENKEINRKKFFDGSKLQMVPKALVWIIVLLLCIQLRGSTVHASGNDGLSIVTSLDIEDWVDEEDLTTNAETLSNALSRKKSQSEHTQEKRVNSKFGNDISSTARMYSKFPLVVRQRWPVFIKIFHNNSLTLKVIGDNNFVEKPDQFVCFKNIWMWRPSHSGIFKMVLYKDNNVVAERKVYVNSSNGKYLQLDELKTYEIKGITYIKAKLEHGRPSGFDDKVNQIFKFTIGEPQVWNKTIKNYGDWVRKKGGYYSINEDSQDFKFNTGIYSIGTFIKSSRSIEFEDVKVINYKKSGLDNIGLKLSGTSDKPEEDGKYPVGTKFDFEAMVRDDIGVDLDYMYLIQDARGKRIIQSYSSDHTYEWQGVGPGKYVIYARVRQAGNTSNNLPNSFEAEAVYPVEIYGDTTSNIKINKVCIGPSKRSHEMQYITIDAENKEHPEPLLYKAYALHDGYSQSLTDYSRSKVIPFYPKSYGSYKIVVLVKNEASDSENARYTETITIKKWKQHGNHHNKE